MFLEVDADGARWLRQCTLLCVDTLQRMFEWIEHADPRVRTRLYPETFRDPDEERAWKNLMRADLEHLVQTRKEIVQGDLGRLRASPSGLFSVPLPAGHEAAWLSTLNAARLALFELHRLVPADMEREIEEVDDDDKQLALVRIHLLAFVQEVILMGGV